MKASGIIAVGKKAIGVAGSADPRYKGLDTPVFYPHGKMKFQPGFTLGIVEDLPVGHMAASVLQELPEKSQPSIGVAFLPESDMNPPPEELVAGLTILEQEGFEDDVWLVRLLHPFVGPEVFEGLWLIAWF